MTDLNNKGGFAISKEHNLKEIGVLVEGSNDRYDKVTSELGGKEVEIRTIATK